MTWRKMKKLFFFFSVFWFSCLGCPPLLKKRLAQSHKLHQARSQRMHPVPWIMNYVFVCECAWTLSSLFYVEQMLASEVQSSSRFPWAGAHLSAPKIWLSFPQWHLHITSQPLYLFPLWYLHHKGNNLPICGHYGFEWFAIIYWNHWWCKDEWNSLFFSFFLKMCWQIQNQWTKM